MTYQKTNWVNNSPPAINAANLNKIETAIDELSSTIVPTQRVLQGGDLNDLEDSGIYAIVSNYTYTNCPVTAGATLTVTRVSSSAIYQNIVSQTQGSWMRAKMSSTGVWTSWSQVNTPVDDTLTVQGAAADAKATGDAIAAVSGGGLDLSDLTLTATQSQTEGFSTLTLFDGTTTKSVEIPVASLDPTDTTLITNIVNAYLNNLVNGDGVSY